MAEKILPHDHGDPENFEQLCRALERAEDFQNVGNIFRQLSDPTRLRLFWLLCHCEECVINLSAMMQMSSPALSHHLRSLRAGGLIVSRREGKEVYYRAASTRTAQLLHLMMEQVMEITCPD